MSQQFMGKINADILAAVLGSHFTINVSEMAERIRRSHEIENIALEDIMYRIASVALANGKIVEFDRDHSRDGDNPALLLEVVGAKNVSC